MPPPAHSSPAHRELPHGRGGRQGVGGGGGRHRGLVGGPQELLSPRGTTGQAAFEVRRSIAVELDVVGTAVVPHDVVLSS